jgi:hypothetical protein
VSLAALLPSSPIRPTKLDVVWIGLLAISAVFAVLSTLRGRRAVGSALEFATEETSVDESTVRTNLWLGWQRTNLILTTKRLAGSVPNTVLIVFPFGRRDVTAPLDRISNIAFDTRFDVVRLSVALAALYIAFASDVTIIGKAVLIVTALISLTFAYTATIDIADSSGKTHRIPVSVLDRAEIERFVSVVNRQLAEEPDVSPRRQPQQPASTLSPRDRIERLTLLADLRNQGILSETEFETEKRKLLDT